MKTLFRLLGLICISSLVLSGVQWLPPDTIPYPLYAAVAGILAAGGGLLLLNKTVFTVSIPALLLGALLAWITAVNLFHGRELFSGALLYLSLLILYMVFENGGRVRRHYMSENADALSLYALALSLLGIAQAAGLLLRSHDASQGITAGMDNPAGLAFCLVAVFPFLMRRSGKRNLWRPLTILPLVVALILTKSRAGLLALVVAGAFYYLPLVRDLMLKRSRRHRAVALGICLLIAGLGLWKMYSSKKDSADGRLLVWRNTVQMVAERPVCGMGGESSFRANYMLFQADYFRANPQSRYARLAGDVPFPYNEYLKVASEYGLPALLLWLAVLLYILLRCHPRSDTERAAKASLAGIALFALFSYPFHYPLAWGLLVFDLAVLNRRMPGRRLRLRKIVSAALIGTAAVLAAVSLTDRYRWEYGGRKQQMRLESVPRTLRDDPYFLYNLAVELSRQRLFDESNEALRRCTRYLHTYDVQMLRAENLMDSGQPEQAACALDTARWMCPSRFYPVYYLFLIYRDQSDPGRASQTARELIRKPVKIASPQIDRMKKQAAAYLADHPSEQ